MKCFVKADQNQSHSEEIDQWLKEDAKRQQSATRLLLLGTGESGKTTIIKQMKILHINGFSEQERLEKVPNIKQNIHESIYDIVNNMDKIVPPVELKSEESKESAEFILNLGPSEPTEYTDEYYDHVQTLWTDSGVKETFQRSNEFQLIDSAGHFLERIDDVRKSNYVPTTEDILFCRVKTITISKIEFSVPIPASYGGGKATFWMYDVGGQRGERRKWISVFEGITAVLFLVAASDFDQTLREDTSKNRLEEAFDVFENVYKSRFIRDAGLIVFLNKQDLLKKKIDQGKRIGKYFPDYLHYQVSEKGEPNDEYTRTKLFMKKKITDIASKPLTFESVGFVPGTNIQETVPPRQVYIHFTIATDTKNIKRVFDGVHDVIFRMNVRDILL